MSIITPLFWRANISSSTRLMWSLDMEFCGYATWSNGWEMNSIHSPEIVWRIVASVIKVTHSCICRDNCPPFETVDLSTQIGNKRGIYGNSFTFVLMTFSSLWNSSWDWNEAVVDFFSGGVGFPPWSLKKAYYYGDLETGFLWTGHCGGSFVKHFLCCYSLIY